MYPFNVVLYILMLYCKSTTVALFKTTHKKNEYVTWMIFNPILKAGELCVRWVTIVNPISPQCSRLNTCC